MRHHAPLMRHRRAHRPSSGNHGAFPMPRGRPAPLHSRNIPMSTSLAGTCAGRRNGARACRGAPGAPSRSGRPTKVRPGASEAAVGAADGAAPGHYPLPAGRLVALPAITGRRGGIREYHSPGATRKPDRTVSSVAKTRRDSGESGTCTARGAGTGRSDADAASRGRAISATRKYRANLKPAEKLTKGSARSTDEPAPRRMAACRRDEGRRQAP
jgi:hypothetical protein